MSKGYRILEVGKAISRDYIVECDPGEGPLHNGIDWMVEKVVFTFNRECTNWTSSYRIWAYSVQPDGSPSKDVTKMGPFEEGEPGATGQAVFWPLTDLPDWFKQAYNEIFARFQNTPVTDDSFWKLQDLQPPIDPEDTSKVESDLTSLAQVTMRGHMSILHLYSDLLREGWSRKS